MTEPLDVFAVIGKENYNWIGQAQTYDEAGVPDPQIRQGRHIFCSLADNWPSYFFHRVQPEIIQLPGKPRD